MGLSSFYWVAKRKTILDNKYQSKMGFKLGIYWVEKLKPILENKYQSKMGFKLGI